MSKDKAGRSMNTQIKFFAESRPVVRAQAGAALIVVLIILVAMTIAGVSGMQMSSLEERMSANSRDRMLALQAAETALRIGQVRAKTQLLSGSNAACTNGLCSIGAAPDPVTYDWSSASTKHVVVDKNDASNGLSPQLSGDPGFFVELAGSRPSAISDGGWHYVARVVSRAQGIDPSTTVLLESYVEIGGG